MTLEEKIKNKTSRVLVIGGGYVGLPLAVECAQSGFSTDVFDLSSEKIDKINAGVSYVGDVSSETLLELKNKKLINGVSLPIYSEINVPDIILICVPTLLNEFGDPDPQYILKAIKSLCQHTFRFDKEYLIILESTVYPGFTKDVLKVELENSKKYFGIENKVITHLVFSPERIDPNNKKYTIKDIPKIIGGVDDESTRLADIFYNMVVKKTVMVSSSAVAEMTKIFENTYRLINISYVNEMAVLCHKMGIDIWEVIEAAATKPFGFSKFLPGPGVGGACIPINPKYLKYKLRKLNLKSKMIDASEEINNYMPMFAVDLVFEALNEIKKSINGSNILVVGVSYKSNINDVRESPSLLVIEELLKKGAVVEYYDPYVNQIRLNNGIMTGITELNKCFDCTVILTHHDCINYEIINSLSFVDMRNVITEEKKLITTKL